MHFYTSFIHQISEYHNGNIIEAVSSNSSQTASYTGLIMIFVIPLYLFNKQISLNSRIRKIVLLMLLFVATNNQVLNFIFHGFHVQSLAPNRFAAFIVFILIEILSDICTIQINLSKRLLTIILTSISVLMGLLILFNVVSDIKYISVILICIYILSIYIPIKEQNKGITIVKRIIYISLIDIIINAIIVFPSNLGSPSDILKVSDEVRKLSSRASDATDPTALTEYITFSSDYGNLGLISDVSALSFFNASTSQNTMEHISFYNIPTGMNSIYYNHGNPLADIMLNIKYHITDDEDYYSTSIYPEIIHQNNLSLHENPYYVSSGFVIPHYDSLDGISVEEYKNAIEYQNSITQCLVSKDLYQTIDCELDSNTLSQTSYYSLGDLYVNSGGNSITTVFLPMDIHFDQNTSGKIYISDDKCLYYVGTVDENVHELVFDYPMYSYEVSEFKPTIAILDESALQLLSETLSTSTLENVVEKGNSIYGEIYVENGGKLYLPYPYSDDWDVYIDNKKAETTKYLGSLCANVSPGNHSIKITYHSPGALLGSIVSITTLLILIIHFLRTQHLSNASESSKTNRQKRQSRK